MKESLLLFYMFVDGRSVNQWAISKNVALSLETEFIEEVSGLTEKGEIQETAQTDSITQYIATDQTSSRGRFKVDSKEEVKLEEGVDDLLQEQTGENDPYDMSIAPIFIYENQMLPIGIYNLSKSFRPNLATIRVLSFGTILIPKNNNA